MVDCQRHRVKLALAIALLSAGALIWTVQSPPAHAAPGVPVAPSQEAGALPSHYELRAVHDPNGTGKFYMGREIAQIMGPEGMAWLDRPQRADEEHPEMVIDAIKLRAGEVVADLGAGSGYITFRLAPKVGNTGKVLAVEIQDEMLETLRKRAAELGVTNVQAVKASETDPHLPAGGVDVVLMVDVYHELAYPFEVMTKVREALKPTGWLVLVEYRKEDPHVSIKEVHKMSLRQLSKEMSAVGFMRIQTVESLPSQHIVIFAKRA